MIGEILAAAVQRIKDLQGGAGPLGYDLHADVFDGQVNEANLPALLQKTPAVFVAFTLGRGKEEGSQRKWDTTLNLVVVTKNLATTQAARQGGPGGEIGAWRIAEDMAICFDQQTLGLDIDAIEPVAIDTLIPGWARLQKAAIVGVTMTTAFRTALFDDVGGNLADFLRVHIDWDATTGGAPEYSDDIETRP